MSKLPSLKSVISATQKTISRFPLEILTAICGTVFAIIWEQKKYGEPQEFYMKAVMSCSLCLVLFLSLSLYFQVSKKNNLLRFLSSLILGSLLVAFVFSFKKRITDVEIQQFIVLNIALHLLVSFAGFLPKKYNQEEFWEFNKQLFLRILTSGLYSIVFYCGLALAILAIEKLFNFDFYNHIYAHVFIFIAGVFNTLFFLNGVPGIDKESTLDLSYPKGLKNFTQFVLLPLISLYLVILICYEAKILITLSLPVGWVSYLVLVFAIFGILSFLLIHPIANENSNLWMKNFNRWFYFLLVPLLVLLFWAILYRINIYGFTHERYYVLLLSVWLSVVVICFLIQKHPKIKFIPISMCLAGFFSIVGPQSADSVSKHSQLSRFESYIQKIDNTKLTFEQQKDLSSIVSFLEDNYGIECMVPLAKNKLDKLYKSNKLASDYEIMQALGYEFKSRYANTNSTNEIYYSYYENEDNNVQNIHGYDLSFNISSYNDLNCVDCTKIENKSYSIKSTKKDYGVDLKINEDIIALKFIDFINNNPAFLDDRSEKITQSIKTDKYDILITFFNVNGNIENKKKIISNYQIKVMMAVK